MGRVYACCMKRVAAAERHKKKGPDWVPFLFGAGNEIRTRDPDLGKVVLYQLSYSRIQKKALRFEVVRIVQK